MTVDPMDVVGFFAEQAYLESNTISNLKAQKLLYYAQGWTLATMDRPLFADDLEAWKHGPVVDKVYHELKRFGSSGLPSGEFPAPQHLPEKETFILLHVWEQKGGIAPMTLANATHREAPWIGARKALAQGRSNVIAKDVIATYFKDAIVQNKLQVSGIPARRDLIVDQAEFERCPGPWVRAAALGAVVQVIEREEESTILTFGQHLTPEMFVEDDETRSDMREVAAWLS